MPKPLCGASTLPAHPPSPINSSLKIVAVSREERFVRVLNQSLEETVDLGGLTLQQLLYGFPVCMYRFPPGTLLAPGHHVTVRPAPREPSWPLLGPPPPLTRRPALSSRFGARAPAAPRSSRRRPWAKSLSTSVPAGDA